MLLLLLLDKQPEHFRNLIQSAVALYGLEIKLDCLNTIMENFDRIEDKSDMFHAQSEIINIVHLLANKALNEGSKEITISTWEEVRKWLCPLPPWIKKPC